MRARDVYALCCWRCAVELEVSAAQADEHGTATCPHCGAALPIEWRPARDAGNRASKQGDNAAARATCTTKHRRPPCLGVATASSPGACQARAQRVLPHWAASAAVLAHTSRVIPLRRHALGAAVSADTPPRGGFWSLEPSRLDRLADPRMNPQITGVLPEND